MGRSIMMAAAMLMMGLCLCSVASVSGQGMAPEPSSASDECMSKLLNMSDCLSYVTEGSNMTAPEKPCCPELAGLVDSNPICLCQLLGKSNDFGFKIDVSRALKLPSICGVSTPPVSLCSAVGVPVGSPTASEGPSMSPVSVSGQGMAPEPSSASDECMSKLLNMSDCLSYVTEGSNMTAPEKPCCPELAGLVDSNPICLCQLLGKSNDFGLKIDVSRALKLPSICGVSTPPASLCSAVGVPVGSPTASEGPSMSPGGQTPERSASDSSTGNNIYGASSSQSSTLAILASLAFVSLPSFF